MDVIAPATAQDRADLLQQLQTKSIDGLLVIETPTRRAAEASPTRRMRPATFHDQLATEDALNRGSCCKSS